MGSKENVSRFVSRLSKRNDPHFHVSRCNLLIFRVLEAGLEPAQPQWPKDFKSFLPATSPVEYDCNISLIINILQ